MSDPAELTAEYPSSASVSFDVAPTGEQSQDKPPADLHLREVLLDLIKNDNGIRAEIQMIAAEEDVRHSARSR